MSWTPTHTSSTSGTTSGEEACFNMRRQSLPGTANGVSMTAAQLAARLPAVGVVRRWSQSLAMLDAIMSPEREYRYFSFDSESGPGQSLVSMRDGSGDEYSITFTSG